MSSTYDVDQTYDWNYDNGPVFDSPIPERRGFEKIKIHDFEVNSPLGVPAGPLINSNYIKLYAALGFDIVVYKTVRSIFRTVHPAPNCVYIDIDEQITENMINGELTAFDHAPSDLGRITITNSFGMPSKNIEEWQVDIAKANSYLAPGQIMPVSIVGTPNEGADIADDYAEVARLAKEAGAKIIEANFSCPNVTSGEGSIYTDPLVSSKISQKIKAAIGDTPLWIKVGYYKDRNVLAEVIKANVPYVQGIAGINTIPMKVYNKQGGQALPGEGRLTSGLCGNAIRDLASEFIKDLADLKERNKYDFLICAVGGVTRAEHFTERLQAGADVVMSATGAMWNPLLALDYHNRPA